jgi:hypothetical protein
MTTKRNRWTALLAGLGTGLLLLGLGTGMQAQSEESARGLTGAWWVTVVQYDCVTGVTRPPFTSLLAFARGGTMSETTANPSFQPGQRSPGYGTWTNTNDGGYGSVDESFILYTAGPFTQGTQRINHSIALTDENHLSDTATVQFYDTHGTLLVSGCARASGVRVE